MTKIKYKPVKNTEIAKVVGKTEGAVRAAKKNNEELYNSYLEEFKLKTYPFITIDEYVKFTNTSKALLQTKIDSKIIPALETEIKDYRGNVVGKNTLVPYCANKIEDLRDDYTFKASKVISVTNRKGGVAKTTNAINIGTMAAMLGYNVLFIDYDTQANASQSFGLRPKFEIEKNIIDLVLEVGKGAGRETVADNIFNLQKKLKTIGKFDVLPNSGDKETQEKAINISKELLMYSTSFKALDMLIDLVRDDYDLIIIDTPPNDKDSLTMVTMATDYFIFSYKPDARSIDGIPMLFSNLKEELEPIYKMHKKDTIKIIGGIISDYNPKINLNQDMAEQAEEDFSNYIKKYNLPKEWTIFKQKIEHLQKFSKIQERLNLGSLISPASLGEKLSVSETKAIRNYLDIVNELMERILIDLYSKWKK